jgi:hypothetical protein
MTHFMGKGLSAVRGCDKNGGVSPSDLPLLRSPQAHGNLSCGSEEGRPRGRSVEVRMTTPGIGEARSGGEPLLSENRIHRRTRWRGFPGAKPFVFLLGMLLFLLGSETGSQAFMIGRLDVEPQLELEEMYDDNVWLRSGPEWAEPVVSDWVSRLRPGLSLAYDYGATDFSASYLTEFDFYAGPKSGWYQTRSDTYAQNNDLELSARHEFGARTSVSLSDSLAIGTNVADLAAGRATGTNPSGILPPPGDYRTNRADLEFTRLLTRRIPGHQRRVRVLLVQRNLAVRPGLAASGSGRARPRGKSWGVERDVLLCLAPEEYREHCP